MLTKDFKIGDNADVDSPKSIQTATWTNGSNIANVALWTIRSGWLIEYAAPSALHKVMVRKLKKTAREINYFIKINKKICLLVENYKRYLWCDAILEYEINTLYSSGDQTIHLHQLGFWLGKGLFKSTETKSYFKKWECIRFRKRERTAIQTDFL